MLPYLIAGKDPKQSDALFQLVLGGALRRQVVQPGPRRGAVRLGVVGGVGVGFREVLEGKVPGRLKAGLVP